MPMSLLSGLVLIIYILYIPYFEAFLCASFKLLELPYVISVDGRVSNGLRWFHFPCLIPVIVRDGFRMHCMPTFPCFSSPCSA